MALGIAPIVFVLLTAAAALAQDSIGSVLTVQGEVFALHSGRNAVAKAAQSAAV